MSLLVVTFNSNSEWDQATRAKKVRMSDSGSLDALKLLTGGQHWILDIDLDFFSTANPFCSLLSKVCMLSGAHRLNELLMLYTIGLSLSVCFNCVLGTAETS